MDSEDERNQPGNSDAGLSNLQMCALNDSMSNLLNTGLEAIHQRLDELQGHPSQPRTRTRRPSKEEQPVRPRNPRRVL